MPYKDIEKRRATQRKYKYNHKVWMTNNPDKVKRYRLNERANPKRLERTMLNNAKRRAKRYGLEFNLKLSDIVIPEFCPLLPTIKLNQSGKDRYKLGPSSPTLDRRDNTKGYTLDNIWVISWKANTIKNDSTLEELETLVQNLRSHSQPEGELS